LDKSQKHVEFGALKDSEQLEQNVQKPKGFYQSGRTPLERYTRPGNAQKCFLFVLFAKTKC